MNRQHALIATLPLFLLAPNATTQEVDRPRARDPGVEVGIFPPGPWNAVTDVESVLVGQVTVIEGARSLNAVVGETNDGGLNDIRNRPITAAHVREALEIASSGPVAEGSVGAELRRDPDHGRCPGRARVGAVLLSAGV